MIDFTWMIENAHWLWWSTAILLLAGEMILPGIFLLWIGVAAGVTGGVVYYFPDMDFLYQGMVFGLLATIAIYFARNYIYGHDEDFPDTGLNQRGQSYVGRTFTVAEAIVHGRGKVHVGDSLWSAEGEDAPEGSLVEIIGVDTTILKVKRAADSKV